MRLDSRISLLWLLGGALAGGRITASGRPAAVPPDFVPPQLIITVDPQFPPELLHSSDLQGEVRIVFAVDAEGHVTDWMLASYTNSLMAQEAARAFSQWRFTPGRAAGQPVGVRWQLDFNFRATGVVTSISGNDRPSRMEALDPPKPIRMILPASALDQPLAVVKSVSPRPLPAAGPGAEARQVVVDFYIDAEGKVRLPLVTQAGGDAATNSAVEALCQWQFAPPRHRGLPVATHAVQAFRFDPGT